MLKNFPLHTRLPILSLVVAALACPVLRADFVTFQQPTGAYLGRTTLADFTDPDNTLIGVLSSGGETLTYDNSLEQLTVPGTWGTWGNPPAVETATPRVGYTDGNASLFIALSKPVYVFGFELEPNDTSAISLSAQFFSGTAPVGTITLSPDGNGGALLYAASTSTNPFSGVLITSADSSDFAIARQRFALVPEPATFGLGGLVLTACLFARRTRHRSALLR